MVIDNKWLCRHRWDGEVAYHTMELRGQIIGRPIDSKEPPGILHPCEIYQCPRCSTIQITAEPSGVVIKEDN